MPADLKNMLHATKLTISGRVAEATSLLQRLLAGDGDQSSGVRTDARPSTDRPPGDHPHSHTGVRAMRDLLPTSLREMFEAGRARGFKAPDPSYAPTREAPPGPRSHGRFLADTFANPAGRRPYKLYVPAGYRGQAIPLVVMLHGCKQSPDDFAVGTRMNRVADEHTIIVAYPGQTTAANGSKCWNWFADEHQHRDRGEPLLIAGITRAVMTRYAIDPDRVYVAGLSAGGAAAAVVGAAYPEIYAAIGVHSGLACGAARDLPSAFAAMRGAGSDWTVGADRAARQVERPPVPTIVFHGDADATVHPVNSDHVIAASTGASSFEKRVHQGEAPGGRRYTRVVYADPAGRAPLEQWTVHGGGHAWAGGDARGSYTDPAGPDATREMIRFFLEHPRTPR
jgi:poly(hydroxyalkanoate) depolymerase family esterase